MIRQPLQTPVPSKSTKCKVLLKAFITSKFLSSARRCTLTSPTLVEFQTPSHLEQMMQMTMHGHLRRMLGGGLQHGLVFRVHLLPGLQLRCEGLRQGIVAWQSWFGVVVRPRVVYPPRSVVDEYFYAIFYGSMLGSHNKSLHIYSPPTLPPPLPRVLLRVAKCLCTGALDHELRPPAVELNLLSERLVLQGSCAFLALLMLNICLCFIRLDARSS